MELIIGGSFQGKRDFALRKFPDRVFADAGTADLETLSKAEGILYFEKAVRRLMEAGEDPMRFTEELIADSPDAVIVSTEIGYGIVPLDAFEREYREAVGRACTRLASFSSCVTRVVCGMGMEIKHR